MMTLAVERVMCVYVAGDDQAATPVGLRMKTDRGHDATLPAGTMWEPTGLLRIADQLFGDQAGTIVIPWQWQSESWKASADAAGFMVLELDGSPWATFRQEGRPPRFVCNLELAGRDSRTPILEKNTPVDAVVRRLAAWQEITGTPFRSSPGVVGTELLRRTMVRKQPQWRDGPVVVEGLELRGLGDITWQTDQPLPAGTRWVHEYDQNAMYMAACTTLSAPWDAPASRDLAVFDPTRAGYWRVRGEDMPDWVFGADHRPPIISDQWRFGMLAPDGTGWLSTPVMEYLLKTWGWCPPVCGAMVAKRATPWLAPWGSQMYALRAEIADSAAVLPEDRGPLSQTVKRAGNEAIGLMNRPGGRCYNPTLRWLLIDQARVNLLRKIDRLITAGGPRPVRINIDAVHLPDPSPEGHAESLAAACGMELSARLGGWRAARTYTIDQWTEKHK